MTMRQLVDFLVDDVGEVGRTEGDLQVSSSSDHTG